MMSNWESEPVVAQVPVSVGVLCVDDQPVFRQVARELIGAIPGFTVLGEASSGEQALALVDEVQPQLVLMDVRMPGMDGVEASRRLSASHPEVLVVLVSSDPSPPPLPGRVGPTTWISKERLCPELLQALWAEHESARQC